MLANFYWELIRDQALCGHLACIIPCNPHNKSERIGTMIVTILRENGDSERSSNLHKVTQLVGPKAGLEPMPI